MHNVFARIIAAILWLEKRLETLAKHPLGRVGMFVFFGAMLFFHAHAIYAEAPAPEKKEPGFLEMALLFIANIALTVAVVLSKLVIVIIQVLLPVMSYNKFSESPVVTAGWAIIRDTVNMFFVIVLIAIAFGTIFGNSRFKWQQQMTKLMIFAIVINFSKTLCGLMIDFGQVVMLTFANAIREIAAGNFVQMLGMGDVYSLSTSNKIFQDAATQSGATGAQAFDWFASSIASVFMMFIVLTTMIMLLAILVYRVVMLWILIVISPLAWFVGGAGDLIKSGAYGEWWKKFICLIAIGPVLTFFLWLTLVVAGAGNISDTAGFVAAGDTDTAGGFLTKIFELNRLISFVIAIAMLYAGFDAANGVCGGAGLGMITDNLKGGPGASGGVRAAKAVAGLGARVGARGARVGASAARAGYKNAVVPLAEYAGGKIDNSALAQKTPLKYATSQGRENMYRNIAKNAGDGIVGKVIGRKATAQAEKLGSERAALMGSGMDAFKNDSGDSKNETLKRMAKSGAFTPAGKREEQALMLDAMGDDKRMKELRASGAWDELWKRHGKDIETNAKGDKTMKAKVDAFKKANADLGGDWPDPKGDPKEATKQAAALSAFALSSKDARQKLDGISSGIKKPKKDWKDKNVPEEYSYVEALEKKLIGNKEQQDAFMQGRGSIYEGMKPDELGRIPTTAIAENLTEAMLTKSVGEKGTVSDQLLASKDARVQAALQKRLSDPANAKMREGLLRGAGVENGKVSDADTAKFISTLTNNPGALSYLDDATFNGLNDVQMAQLGTEFADTDVLKSAIANYRKDPQSDAAKLTMERLQTVLEKDPTLPMIEAQGYLSAQKKAIDEGTRMQKIAAGVKAMPGQVRERMNASIDDTSFETSVDTAAQIPELEYDISRLESAVSSASPGSSYLKQSLKALDQKRDELAAATERVQAVKDMPEQIQRLDEEITNQTDQVLRVNKEYNDAYVSASITDELQERYTAAQDRLNKLRRLKTEMEKDRT